MITKKTKLTNKHKKDWAESLILKSNVLKKSIVRFMKIRCQSLFLKPDAI